MKEDASPTEIIKAHRKRVEEEATIPDDMTILEIAAAIVRGKIKPSSMQTRMVIELLPYHMPKLSAVAHATMLGQDFAAMLDRAIERTLAGPPTKLIESQAIEMDEEES